MGPTKNVININFTNYITRSLMICNTSSNIVRVTKSRMRWAGDVTRVVDRRIKGFSGETCGKETNWKTQA
jgi:hypothetical protein